MLLSVIAVLCFMGTARAMNFPHWPIDYVVLKSELIAQGHFIDEKHFLVEKVFFGTATPLQTIVINDRMGLTRVADDPDRECDPIQAINRTTGTPCRTVKQAGAVVFLQKLEGQWEPTALGSGVKWLLDGKVLGYQQFSVPGAYVLTADRETTNAADLFEAVERALEKRARFEAALQKKAQQRIEGLMPFVEDQKGYLYWKDALYSLAATRPPASEVLRDLAEKLKGQPLRVEVLKSIGESGDKNLTLYLLGVVAAAKRIVKTLGSQGLSDQQRQAVEEWSAALCSAAKLIDPKALPILRDSLSDSLQVGGFYGSQARSCIEGGFKQMPAPENVAIFEEVYARSPQEYKWGQTKWAGWGVLNFLNDHKFPRAIPLLAAQLDHPDSLFRAQAQKLLTEIVGSDLGADKTPWLEWRARRQHLKQASRVETR